MPIDERRTSGNGIRETRGDETDIDGFFNFKEPGDAVSGYWNGSFKGKDKVFIKLRDVEYDQELEIDEDGKEIEIPERVAVSIDYRDLKDRFQNYFATYGPIKSNEIVTITYISNKDVGRKNPMKLFSLMVKTDDTIKPIDTSDEMPF